MVCSACGAHDVKGSRCPYCGQENLNAQTHQAHEPVQHAQVHQGGGFGQNQVQQAQPSKAFAIVSLIFGILAMTIPVPVLDVILGIAGIVLYSKSKKAGYSGGLAVAGLVVSIIGTIVATIYTLGVLLLVSVM